jgi:CpXC protein
MSTFARKPVSCPHCGDRRRREVVTSLSVGRSPHLRKEILAGTFQVFSCEACGRPFTYTGQFSYLDLERRRFIGVFPREAEQDWPRHEQRTARAYEANLGAGAPSVARSLGEGFVVRCVFGLSALREKLLIEDAGLDDVLVEAAKLDLFRSVAGLPLDARRRPRLVDIGPERVHFALPSADDDRDQRPFDLPVERPRFDEFLAAGAASAVTLRETLAAGPYVDTGRLLITPR